MAIRNVAILEKDVILAEGLKRILEIEGKTITIYPEINTPTFMSDITEENPDLILMVLSNMQPNSQRLIEEIHSKLLRTKIMILSKEENLNIIPNLLMHGVQAFLPSNLSIPIFLEAISVMEDGGVYLHHDATNSLVEEYLKIKRNKHETTVTHTEETLYQSDLLSVREVEILYLLAYGCKDQEIGDSLYLSHLTVKNHVHSIKSKLGAQTRTAAVTKGITQGIIDFNVLRKRMNES
ncbi:response regulator transcription factor [Pontibacillus halophilus]|uniref:response regulator transcription factor n=1 Tax=Pontibacillus halophilus TaxID=516704 RepID=UPI00040CF726|nr:response regulator transcription factor [Pontibacillus halophilus]